MPELFFELGCEEIPADDLLLLPVQLEELASKEFVSNRLVIGNLETHATARRLVLHCMMDAMQQELREQKIGPPAKVALDSEGKPTKAGLGFARGLNIPFDQVKVITTPKGEYLSAEIAQAGEPAAVVVSRVLAEILPRLSFKKFMKWGSHDFVFGRPIRSIVLLFDGETVPFQIAGVSAGRTTFGHRFLGEKKIVVSGYEDYAEQLKKNFIVLKYEDRIKLIESQLQNLAQAAGGQLNEDRELLQIMANEVEYPQVLSGGFPAEFLVLPQEILINAMRKHQKYFTVLDPSGKLLPVFLTVLNTHPHNPALIRQGHERVLQARLRDASFFWKEDRKKALESRISDLDRVTYHEKLGSYAAKVERMRRIGAELLQALRLDAMSEDLDRTIRLSKVDLVTLMVGEFPELQGIMGGLYAREEKMPEQLWQALYDQYKPAGAEGETPREMLGALLSITDRIDTIASGYVLNMIPSGSRDPYALRRAATALVRTALDHNLSVNLNPVIEHALALHNVKTKLTLDEMRHSISELLFARLRFLMEARGIQYDFLDAVLAAEKESLLSAYVKTNVLWAKHESPELKILAKGFKRINNIISGETVSNFDAELLQEDGENRLYRVFSDLEFRVKQLIEERQFADALDIMVTLGPEIDNFFDEVMVMVEDEKIKNNRIALLRNISDLYRRIADFSALQIEI